MYILKLVSGETEAVETKDILSAVATNSLFATTSVKADGGI